MTAAGAAALLAVLVLGVVAMVWPLDWPKAPRTRSAVSYFVSLAAALLVLLLFPLGHGPTAPFFALLALLAWVALGALWLIRRNPQIPNPAWTRRPWSIADWGLIAILILAGLAALFA